MPTLFSQAWGTAAQAYSIDLYPSSVALAHDSARTGAILNLSALEAVQDVLIWISGKASGAVGSDKLLNWFAAGCVDGGTLFTGNIAASTTYATFSANLVQYPNLLPMYGSPVALQDTSLQYGGPFSLAARFSYVLPTHVILGVHNRSNVALTSNNTDNLIKYQVIYTKA